MALIYDGVPVFVAVPGATALAADQNTYQAKMILGLSEREVVLPLQTAETHNTTNWVYIGLDSFGAPPFGATPFWSMPNNPAANDVLEIPLCFAPEDMRITQIDVWVDALYNVGDADQGEIALYERPLSIAPGVTAVVQDVGGAAPWGVSGAGTIENKTIGGLTLDITATSEYTLVFTSQSVAAARNCKLYGASVHVMYHKGT